MEDEATSYPKTVASGMCRGACREREREGEKDREKEREKETELHVCLCHTIILIFALTSKWLSMIFINHSIPLASLQGQNHMLQVIGHSFHIPKEFKAEIVCLCVGVCVCVRACLEGRGRLVSSEKKRVHVSRSHLYMHICDLNLCK